MNKILIADDHAVVRRGLRQIISDEPDFEVIGEAQTAQEALDLIAANGCDVVLLDIALPDKNGLEVLQEAKTLQPELPILILSMHPEDQFAMRALRLGASGYLTKETAPDELILALRKVLSGKMYISPKAAEQLVYEISSPITPADPERLSKREYQVLQKIALGKTASQIAEELSLSVKTVNTYRARLLGKMKMKSNAELMHYAMHSGLADAGSKEEGEE